MDLEELVKSISNMIGKLEIPWLNGNSALEFSSAAVPESGAHSKECLLNSGGFTRGAKSEECMMLHSTLPQMLTTLFRT